MQGDKLDAGRTGCLKQFTTPGSRPAWTLAPLRMGTRPLSSGDLSRLHERLRPRLFSVISLPALCRGGLWQGFLPPAVSVMFHGQDFQLIRASPSPGVVQADWTCFQLSF